MQSGTGPSAEPTAIEGPARVGRLTKELVRRLLPGDVAVIAHRDLDALAAQELVAARVAAVLDACDAATGRIPNRGPDVLAEAAIPFVDCLGDEVVELVKDGDPLTVEGDAVWCRGSLVGRGRLVSAATLEALRSMSEAGLSEALAGFVSNTLEHAGREMDILTASLGPPPISLDAKGAPCVVVIRGNGYREDFAAVARSFLAKSRARLIAVDGAADCARERGFEPDVIVGDMDSVSDEALRACKRLVAHAAPDGVCPGALRLQRLGLEYAVFVCRGTSEDAALLLAESLGADPIVAVGMARGALDFLERGRPGMASSWLVRLRLGARLIDAHGFSCLADWGEGNNG